MPKRWKIGEFEVVTPDTTMAELMRYDLIQKPDVVFSAALPRWLREQISRQTLVQIYLTVSGSMGDQRLPESELNKKISQHIPAALKQGRLLLLRPRGGGGGGEVEGSGTGASGGGQQGTSGQSGRDRSAPKKTSIAIRVVDEDHPNQTVAAKVRLKLPDGSFRDLVLEDGHDFQVIRNLDEGTTCEVSLPAEYDAEWRKGGSERIG